MQENLKKKVKEYWNEEPCGTGGIVFDKGTHDFFQSIKRKKDYIEPIRHEFYEYDKWRDKKILEVGCGAGIDLAEFARHGALVTGIDLSSESIRLAKEQLSLYCLKGCAFECDAEKISFKDNVFDLVVSWGVLHHTANPQKAINEIYRILKPDGEIRVMLYHKPSSVCLQMYLLFGLLKLKPFRSIDDILWNHHESIGTKAYSLNQVRDMFVKFRKLSIETKVSTYDIRYLRDKYFPMWFKNLIPDRFGWHLLIKGVK